MGSSADCGVKGIKRVKGKRKKKKEENERERKRIEVKGKN